MYRTSSAYKEMMKRDLRERSYMYVFLGLVNRDAQENASITSDLLEISDSNVFDGTKFEVYYATAEEDFATADTYFVPEKSSQYTALNQGAISKDILGAITFTFDHTIDKFSGLTIDFGAVYPTEFSVTNGTQTGTYTNDTEGRYILQEEFLNSDYITITPISMVGGQQRMRIHSIMFGMGFQFVNDELLSTKRVCQIDHLSRELPKKTFEFTIDNLNQEWTMDNPDSYARSLEEKQIVQATYGRELDNGKIYKIPSLYMALSGWSSDHSTAI